MEAYLDNGRKYDGRIYVLEGIVNEEEKGRLTASCFGELWGLKGVGTCLTYLYDKDGNQIVMNERFGESGSLKKDGSILWERDYLYGR